MAVTITNAALSGIYERLNSAPTYHPLEAETFSDWAIEAGDIVTVTRGEKSYASPVQSTRMVWRGAPEIVLNSTGNKERASVSKISRQKYGRGSGAMRNSEEIHNAVYSEDGVLYSLVEQTASSIRTEVGVAISGMAHSVIEQTATYIRTEIENAASSISASVIEQTAEYVRTEVASVASGVAWSVVEQTMTNIQQQIAGRARVYVQWNDPSDDHDMMNGDLWYKKRVNQTWDEIGQESWDALEDYKWQDLYGLKHYVWKNGAWQQVMDTAAIVESEVKVEEDREHWAVLATARDIDNQIYQSNLTVTAQKISSDVSTAQSKIYSTIAQTATNIVSRVENVDAGLRSRIEQTATSIRAEVSDTADGLEAMILVTATGVYSGVSDYVNGNFSTILQTSTNIAMAVKSAKDDLQSAINVEKARIGLVVEGTGANAKIKPAEIVAAINAQTGQSAVKISADIVSLDGATIADRLAGQNVEFQDLELYSGSEFSIGNDSVFYFGSDVDFEYNGNYADVENLIVDASVSGNTLTLTKMDGSKVPFSKATSLSGAWSSGTFTVTASPQGNTYTATAYAEGNGTPTKVSGWQTLLSVPYKIKSYVNGDETPVDTGKTGNIQADATAIFNAGWEAYFDKSAWWQKPSNGNGWVCKYPARDQSGAVEWFDIDNLGYVSAANISITTDNVGHSTDPGGTEIWSSTNFVKNRWYKFTVSCRGASKIYKIYMS